MSTTYTQKLFHIQKKEATSASSILDASSQSGSLQFKADLVNNAAQRAEAPRPNNTGMPDNLKSGIESLSGFSMDDVRVHYNSSKPATVQALAYTQGTDVHVAPGQEKHLPHEAWHVAQQMAGRVSPTTNINGMPVNDNAALEHEADVMGERAVQCMACNKNVFLTNCFVDRPTIQCVVNDYNRLSDEQKQELKQLFNVNKSLCGVFYNNNGELFVYDDDNSKYFFETLFSNDDVQLVNNPENREAFLKDLNIGLVTRPHKLSLWDQDWIDAKSSIRGFMWSISQDNCDTDIKDASSMGVYNLKHKSHGNRGAGGEFVTTAFFVNDPEMRLYAVGMHVKGFPARYKILWVNQNIVGNSIKIDKQYDL